MANAGIQIKGLDELIKKTGLPVRVIGEPLRKFFTRTSVAIQRRARRNAPVDRGQLRQAISYEVDDDPLPAWAKVGVISADFSTPLGKKAFSMEYGTGLLAEGPNAKGKRYFPPPAALDLWAKRHGFPDGRTVAFIIWRRGGLAPRRYLRTALAESQSDVSRYAAKIGKDIAAELDKGN